eukprot:7778200-Pyramimonas_sp.AAC.1
MASEPALHHRTTEHRLNFQRRYRVRSDHGCGALRSISDGLLSSNSAARDASRCGDLLGVLAARTLADRAGNISLRLPNSDEREIRTT